MKTKVKYKKYAQFPDIDTLKEIVLFGAEQGKDKKQFMFYNFDGEVETKTFNQVFHDVKGLGQYLYKLGLRGKKVAVLSENSYYWIACYYSIITGKMTSIPLDPKLPYDELTELMVRSGCDAIYYSDEYTPAVEMMKNDPEVKIEDFYSLIDEGYKALESGEEDYLKDEVLPDDLAFIVYTSGTTGKSKGVMLTQNNVASDTVASCRAMTGGHAIGFLPLHHAFSWVGALFSGCLLTEWGFICRSLKDIQKDMLTYHPQNFSAVPLAVETIYKKIWFTAKKTGRDQILAKGLKISNTLMKLGIDKRRKIFSEIIKNLGGELEIIVCGGAYLDEKYEKGMYDFGIQIINGYGITECSPAATAAAFDGDWFKTGDYGYIDEDGFLFFRGRKKNLIVLSNGKNVSPEEIEDKLSTIEYVKEVVVYDEGGYITAEFFLDTVGTPDAKDRIKNDVNVINKNMPLYKQVSKVKTRDTEFPKTTTLKILRNYKD